MSQTNSEQLHRSYTLLGYQPALDGLRAIAIIPVLFLHAHFQLGKYGFIGVDLFFALSGFLITTLLLEEYARKQTLNVGAFLLRRLFRLLPALLIVLFFVFIYSIFVQDEVRRTGIHGELLSSLFYVNNISWLWGWGGESIILGHTWSLAVEEQFYLVWPFVLIVVLWRRNLKLLELFLCFFVVLSIFYKCSVPNPVYNSIIREPIFIGCLFALLRWRYQLFANFPKWLLYFVSFAFIILGTLSFPLADTLFSFKIFRNSWGLISVLLIAGVLANPTTLIVRILHAPLFVWIGKISYGLYLWHLPVFRLFYWHSTLPSSISFLLKFLITFLLAALSWKYFEKPVQQWGRMRFVSNQRFK